MRLPRPFSNYARHFPPDSVTSFAGSAEEDPRDAGMKQRDVEAIWSAVTQMYETGLHPAVALCIRRSGHVILDRAIGHIRGNAPDDPEGTPLVQATPKSLFNLYSASKCVTSILVHALVEKGDVHLDKPVAEYIPEFSRHGKGRITLRHVMSHRAGVPNVPGVKIDLETASDPKAVMEIICDAKPVSHPGQQLAYHALTMGYIAGAVAEAASGKDLRALLTETIREPLGFQHLNYGVAPSDIPLVAQNAFTGAPAFPPYSANIIATANEASRYFEMLLREGELDGTRVLDPGTIRHAVEPQHGLEYDRFMNMPVRYGLGFMLGHRWVSLFGHDTPAAFGHIGFTAVTVWADPERQISAALMTSGKPFITPGQVLWLNVARAVSRACPKIA
jgi:CubicO group peptidase (beta-lactamase class C family)